VIVAGVVLVVKSLKAAGLPALQSIPDGVFDYVLAALGVTSVATIRAGIAKTE
jgi:hypothetical protein